MELENLRLHGFTQTTMVVSSVCMDILTLPLAYKFVATAVMLAEINHCATQLKLPCERPVTEKSIRVVYVARPLLSGFGGTVETDDFSFSFSKSGRLRFISRQRERFLERIQQSTVFEPSFTNSTLSANEAYSLATNWLWLISVDVIALEKKFHPVIRQVPCYLEGSQLTASPGQAKQPTVTRVDWGDGPIPRVRVAIFTATRELLGVYQEDESYSQRHTDLLRNVSELLAISDAEYESMSNAEKDELIRRFASFCSQAAATRNAPLDHR